MSLWGVSGSLLAAVLAIGAALCIAIGTAVRQRAAAGVPAAATGAFGPITTLVRTPDWWAGTIASAAGYGLQAAALGVGSILLVQPLLVLSLLFALPLGARLTGRRVTGREWLWAGALTAAVAVLVVLGDPKPGEPRAVTEHWIVVVAVGLPLVLWCLHGARRRTGTRRALLYGIAAGALFGMTAVLTKGVVHLAGLGPSALPTSVEPYALVAVAVVATAVQQSAFQAGELQTSLPASTIMEPLVASLLGVVVLGEYLDADRGAAVILVLALFVVVAAVIALARASARHTLPAPDPTPPSEAGTDDASRTVSGRDGREG